MQSSRSSWLLKHLFCGVTENTFQAQLGVVDPPLIDYLSELLLRFIRQDALVKVRNLHGERLHDIGAMLAEADARIGEARREVHRHIGDYALFWAGLYPEALRSKRTRVTPDPFSDFCAHGKRAYLLASLIEVGDELESPESELLVRLSEQFEMCAYGLREVRRELERGEDDGDSSRPLLIN
jgi:hypothetical protein